MSEVQQNIDTDLVIFGSTLAGSYSEPMTPPGFRIRKRAGNWVYWEFMGHEARGRQAQIDKYENSYAGWASTTADSRFRGYLFNPLAITRASQSFGGTAGDGPVVYADGGTAFGLVMAQGSTANRCLATGITSVSPAPFYATYDPGATITAIMVGPVNSTNRVLIGREGTTIDVHSAVGTTTATSHSNLSSCWGGAVSPTDSANAGVPAWLFYANGGIWKLSTAVAANTAPTQTWANVNDGGCVLGFDTLEESPFGNRMYMLIPLTDQTHSAWHTRGSNPVLCKLAHINEDGVDLVNVQLPMAGVHFGRLWQRKAVVSDGNRVILYNGKTAWDANIFAALSLPSSSYKANVVGLGGDESSLRALVQIMTTGGVGTLQKWEYNERQASWTPVSGTTADISIAASSDASPYVIDRHSVNYGPSIPYSSVKSLEWVSMYNTGDVTWDRQFVTPRGVNPYIQYQGIQSIESSGIHTYPAWIMPGNLAGHPSITTEVDGRLLDLDSSAGSSVLYEQATRASTSNVMTFTNTPIKRTFTQGDGVLNRVYHPASSPAWFLLQQRLTLTSGTSATGPNAANLITRGVTFLDDVIKTPGETGI